MDNQNKNTPNYDKYTLAEMIKKDYLGMVMDAGLTEDEAEREIDDFFGI